MLIRLITLSTLLSASPSLVRVDALDVSKDGGRTVTILGPPTLLERLQDCRMRRGEHQTTLDWGDGSVYDSTKRARIDCRTLHTHTYKAAGKYSIKAAFTSTGPSGQTVVDWESDLEYVAK